MIGIGVLIEFAAFRPLRTASPLAKLAASLGVLLVAQAAVSLAFGIGTQPQPTVLPTNTVKLLGAIVPVDRLILPAIVLFATLALSLFFKLSRFGLATRAASENEVGAMLIGLAPNQLALINTVAATIVAGALGVLAASITQLDSTALPLQVVPALTAALFANFTSFWIAALVGLSIGMLENILYYLQTFSWFPTDHGVAMPGIQPLLVFILMVIAMFIRGTRLPSRGELIEQRLPFAPRAKRLWPSRGVRLGGGGRRADRPSLRLPAGADHVAARHDHVPVARGDHRLRRPDLDRAARARGDRRLHPLAPRRRPRHRVSARHVDRLARRDGVRPRDRGLGAARPRGQPRGRHARRRRRDRAVRLPEHHLGRRHARARRCRPRRSSASISSPYGGFRGLDGKIPSPVFGFFVVAITVALGLFVANLRRSGLGQRMLAVRSNERAAAATGVNVTTVKLAAFGISSCIAGIGGTLYGYNFSSVTVTRFSALTALSLIAFAYVGGITTVAGAIFGGLISVEALFPYALEKWFGVEGNWALLVGGARADRDARPEPRGRRRRDLPEARG